MRIDSKKSQSNLCLRGLFIVLLSFLLTTSVAFHSSTLPSHFSTRSSSSPSLILAPQQQHLKSTSSPTKLNTWNNDEINGPDKIKACIPYMLPLIDGDVFGQYIYQRVPPLKFLDDLFLAPLVGTFEAFPFLGIILFLLLSIGTRGVEGISREVRFNAQQAVLIDIALILPSLIGQGLDGVDIPRMYLEMGNNFAYYGLMSAIIYSCFMNLRGRKPNGIPYVSDAAEYMTGPF